MDAKDRKRVEDIIGKALGDTNKMVALATTMANRIGTYSKAEGRAMVAAELLGPEHPVTEVFHKKANELAGRPDSRTLTMVETTQHNEETLSNTIYFPTASAVALWEWEFTGQLSDGAWENTQPHDHWQVWCNMNVKIGNSRCKPNRMPQKTGYNFGGLKSLLGDRMMAYARFGKAVGDDVLEMGSEVRCMIEEFPANGPFNLEEWKEEQCRAKDWRKAEYYWKGLEQKHIDAFYNTTYTDSELSADIREIKKAMKNIER